MVKGKAKERVKAKKKSTGIKMQRGLRFALEEGEIYAAVTKIFGGSQCEVVCADGVKRRCIIRAKFRGRQKRDNRIEVGTWVLVGLREWGSLSAEKQVCDLLTVYSTSDKESLKKNGGADFTALLSGGNKDVNSIQTNDVVFTNEVNTSMKLAEYVAEEIANKEHNTDTDADTAENKNNENDIFVDDI